MGPTQHAKQNLICDINIFRWSETAVPQIYHHAMNEVARIGYISSWMMSFQVISVIVAVNIVYLLTYTLLSQWKKVPSSRSKMKIKIIILFCAIIMVAESFKWGVSSPHRSSHFN